MVSKTIYKIVELILILMVLACYHFASETVNLDATLFTNGVIVGYAILLPTIITGIIFDINFNKNINLIITFAGFPFFFMAGAILIDISFLEKQTIKDKMMLAAGYLCIVNSLAFLLESLFTVKQQT